MGIATERSDASELYFEKMVTITVYRTNRDQNWGSKREKIANTNKLSDFIPNFDDSNSHKFIMKKLKVGGKNVEL